MTSQPTGYAGAMTSRPTVGMEWWPVSQQWGWSGDQSADRVCWIHVSTYEYLVAHQQWLSSLYLVHYPIAFHSTEGIGWIPITNITFQIHNVHHILKPTRTQVIDKVVKRDINLALALPNCNKHVQISMYPQDCPLSIADDQGRWPPFWNLPNHHPMKSIGTKQWLDMPMGRWQGHLIRCCPSHFISCQASTWILLTWRPSVCGWLCGSPGSIDLSSDKQC